MMMHPTCQVLLAILVGFTVINLFRLYFSEKYFDLLEAEQDSIDLKTTFLHPDPTEIFEKWHTCFSENLLYLEDPEKFWQNFEGVSQKCDLRGHVDRLGIVTLKKYEKLKHVIFPKIYNMEPHNLFSIGIGSDIQAEKHYKRRIDNLWFDGEGEEFDLGFFEIFYRNGRFDMNGIEVCQINLEIHRNPDSLDRMTKFMEFIKILIREKRYGVFCGDQFVNNRFFMFNFESDYCLKKFLNRFQ